MNDKTSFNSVCACIGTLATCLFGNWDTILMVLVIFMALDYITGLMGAYIKKCLSSDIGFKGILRKTTILIVLIVAVQLDKLLNDGMWVFRTLVCYFYIANEGISLLENASKIGVPVPQKLVKALIQLKEESEMEGDSDGSSSENDIPRT